MQVLNDYMYESNDVFLTEQTETKTSSIDMKHPYETLIECEIFRYNPSLRDKFISRWMIVTKEHLSYYKSRIAAMYPEKPL